MFEEFKKIPRIFREMTITEKIDGTNGQIMIVRNPVGGEQGDHLGIVVLGEDHYYVWAGSRNRWVYPGKDKDNHGFAAWVHDNAHLLVERLGEGRHFGEWWGSGIQRGYGLKEKRFSLFNPKWNALLDCQVIPPGLGVVPVLYTGQFDTSKVVDTLDLLRREGSRAVPNFLDPEGVVIYHHAANAYFKATIKDDEQPKGRTQLLQELRSL